MSNYTIHTLDLNFQGYPTTIASYLVEGPDGLVLIETGPGSTLATALAGIKKLGFQPKDIRHVLLTHIHFDHAGAAGWWAQQGAHVYVHYFGARHLIAPDKLIASATRIYGEKMDTLWGEILPAPAENVTELHDSDTVEVAGLTFTAHETPGHARHHHVYQLEDIVFTGDAGGILLPHFGMVDLPAPPPEFELEVWLDTVDRIIELKPRVIYPTHFGKVTAVTAHLHTFKQLLVDCACFIKERMDAGVERDDLLAQYTHWQHQRARLYGLADEQIMYYETANPIYMSIDGMMRYWRKKGE